MQLTPTLRFGRSVLRRPKLSGVDGEFLHVPRSAVASQQKLSLSSKPTATVTATDERLVSFAQRCTTTHNRSKKKHAKAMKEAAASAKAFSEYYRNMYGTDRWDDQQGDDGTNNGGLCRALMDGPTCHAALMNRLHGDEDSQNSTYSSMEPIPWMLPTFNLDAVWINGGLGRLPLPTLCSSSQLLNYYCLDPSSLLPVMALNLTQHAGLARVLDMCAAPGGKTLAILQTLFGQDATIQRDMTQQQQNVVVANEMSRNRRTRLDNVLSDYVPLPLHRSALIITGMNGTLLGSASIDPQTGVHFASDSNPFVTEEDGGYTHVLCDVPCSGERHVLQSSSSLAGWSAGSSRHLQKKQLALLKAAVSACRPGGKIIYSTCSINIHENDDVVGKLLTKRGDIAELVSDPLIDVSIGEDTQYGRMILPDHSSCRGMGPMYVSALRKK